ncbi:MAG: T9SS type A sorting domain-containing protein, partial [Ignavibacteriae bacterium]|nr:T9SS type A sorting domain-containing protein [Ignavibacteriota bacterium]
GMEKIDPVTYVATPVALSGVTMSEPQGAVYLGGGSFSITDFNFSANTFTGYIVSMAGVVSFPVPLPYQLRGLGFYNSLLPVELSSFVSAVSGRDVTLNWTTANETNNSGFDIERSSATGGVIGQTSDVWTKVGSVSGHGTTTSPNSYTFTDRNLAVGKFNYRLKQIDFNGNFEYFELSNEVNIGIPSNFSLSQNYPNPFNPTTNLEFGIPELGFVSLKVFDISGKEVMTLVNEQKDPGYYSVSFNGANLSSGIYFYTIQAGSFVSTKKMTLIK